MSPITVIAHFEAEPGCEKELEQILRVTVQETHKEPGCRLYALHRLTEDASKFVLVERWDSQAALDLHFETAHLKTLRAKLPGLVASEPSVKIYSSLPEGDPEKGVL